MADVHPNAVQALLVAAGFTSPTESHLSCASSAVPFVFTHNPYSFDSFVHPLANLPFKPSPYHLSTVPCYTRAKVGWKPWRDFTAHSVANTHSNTSEQLASPTAKNNDSHHSSFDDVCARHPAKAVCLDYLKGICEQKRWKCKFAHPPLNLSRPNIDDSCGSHEICEVWVLTGGYCKFGEKCHYAHPPLEDCGPYSGICAVPETLKSRLAAAASGVNQENPVAPSLNNSGCIRSWDSDNPSPPSPVLQQIDDEFYSKEKALRKICGILNKLVPDRFDKLAEDLYYILCRSNGDGLFAQVILLIFSRAVKEPRQLAIYASLCRRLWWWLPANQRDEIPRQLIKLVRTLDENCTLDNQDPDPLTRLKRLHNIEFVGHLLKEGLFDGPQTFQLWSDTIERLRGKLDAADCSDAETALCIEIACRLLILARRFWTDPKCEVPIDRALNELEQLVSNNKAGIRLQLLVSDARAAAVCGPAFRL